MLGESIEAWTERNRRGEPRRRTLLELPGSAYRDAYLAGESANEAAPEASSIHHRVGSTWRKSRGLPPVREPLPGGLDAVNNLTLSRARRARRATTRSKMKTHAWRRRGGERERSREETRARKKGWKEKVPRQCDYAR